jgi:hypothetical protein
MSRVHEVAVGIRKESGTTYKEREGNYGVHGRR